MAKRIGTFTVLWTLLISMFVSCSVLDEIEQGNVLPELASTSTLLSELDDNASPIQFSTLEAVQAMLDFENYQPIDDTAIELIYLPNKIGLIATNPYNRDVYAYIKALVDEESGQSITDGTEESPITAQVIVERPGDSVILCELLMTHGERTDLDDVGLLWLSETEILVNLHQVYDAETGELLRVMESVHSYGRENYEDAFIWLQYQAMYSSLFDWHYKEDSQELFLLLWEGYISRFYHYNYFTDQLVSHSFDTYYYGPGRSEFRYIQDDAFLIAITQMADNEQGNDFSGVVLYSYNMLTHAAQETDRLETQEVPWISFVFEDGIFVDGVFYEIDDNMRFVETNYVLPDDISGLIYDKDTNQVLIERRDLSCNNDATWYNYYFFDFTTLQGYILGYDSRELGRYQSVDTFYAYPSQTKIRFIWPDIENE